MVNSSLIKPTSLSCSDTPFPMIPRTGRCAGWQLSGAESPIQSDERAMAATGGGKIRSRRYHIASKPYAKSKQVNGGKVFVLTVIAEHVTLTVVPLFFSFCNCFVGDISWPAVSARGLHALLACPADASELASWLVGDSLAKSDGLDRSNHSTMSRLG